MNNKPFLIITTLRGGCLDGTLKGDQHAQTLAQLVDNKLGDRKVWGVLLLEVPEDKITECRTH